MKVDGARAKLTRATKHQVELEQECAAFNAREPYTVTTVETAAGDLEWRLKVRERIPESWSAIVGDLVHNLRAALDHLAWDLVAATGARPTDETMFPIGRATAAKFAQTVRQRMRGASPASLRFIRRLRAFPGGNELLTTLHALDIHDKHKTLLVVGSANVGLQTQHTFTLPNGTKIETPALFLREGGPLAPVKDGHVVYTVMKAARLNEHEFNNKVHFEWCIAGVPGLPTLPLVRTLKNLQLHVTRIVDIAEARL